MKKYSKDGYKRNSKDRKNPYNIIPSGKITMKDVDFPVHGTDNLGNSQIMMPGGEYVFPGNEVFEVPLAQNGIELETQPVEINTEGLRRPLHIHGQPIISDNLSENPMDQTPRNYVNDRIEYWEDPNSLAKSRMDGDYLDDNFIEPMGQTSDRVLDYVKNRNKTDFENDRKIFLKNLSNIAFLDMTDDQKYAQELLEEYAANNEDPFDMISNYEKYGYETMQELFEDRPDIKHIGRMSMNEDANYETSSAAVAMTADDEFLERHADDIRLYNIMNSTAIKEGRKEKRELSYERGDLLEKEYIDTFLEDHGEDPNDPKWDKIRAFIIMNPDMHKLHSEMDEDDYNTTLAHEIGHVERAEFLSDQDIYLLSTFNNSYDNLDKDERTDHHSNTGEAYADITAIRQDMLDRGIYDWRYEQMTNDHWQQYLSEYEEDDYPLVLQRTIERYRVLPGEEEWDTHNKKQLETKDQDTNIIYLNNNIADAEIGDDVDMGYAQEGGELKKFQGGGEDDYAYENMIHANMQTQYQNEVKNPGAYPQPDMNDIWISEDSEESYFTEMSVLEEKLKALQGGLMNINTDFINETTENAMSGRDDLSLQVDHKGGLGHSVINDITNSKYNDILKENEKAKIEAEIVLLQEEAKIINAKYIKPEYIADPSDPNSFYHEHYLKEQKYISAEKEAYYNANPQAFLDDNPNVGAIITQGPSREEQERKEKLRKQQEYMSQNKIPPNMMWMVYSSPGLTSMYQQAQITGDYSGINQQVANFSPGNPQNLIMGVFGTPLPILNYGVRIGKLGRIPGLTDDIIAPILSKAYKGAKTYVPGVKYLDDLVAAANSNKNVIHTPETLFYRNGNTVGLRPNVKRPPAFSESQWRHLQTLEWDISNLHKVYPKLDVTKVLPSPVKSPSSLGTATINPTQQAVNTSIAAPVLLTGPPAPVPVNYQTLGKGNQFIYDQGVLKPKYEQNTELGYEEFPPITLQLNSLKNINKLDKNVKKDGTIGINQIKGFANNVSAGDKLHIQKVLNSPKYKDLKVIPLQEFKNDVSASIIPLNHVVSTNRKPDGSIVENQLNVQEISRYAGYGLYDPRGGNVDPVLTTQPQVGLMDKNYYTENIDAVTVSLQNIDELGAGNSHLNSVSEKSLEDNPNNSVYDLAWFRGWNDRTLPQQFFLQEVQNNIGHNPRGTHDGETLDPLMRSKVDASNLDEAYGLQMTSYVKQLQIQERRLAEAQKRVDSGYMNGQPMNEWELKAQIDVVESNKRSIQHWNDRISDLETSYQNYDVKNNLIRGNNGKNMLRRTLAESVIYAANNGNLVYNFPTVQTYAKLSGKEMDLKDLSDFKLYNKGITKSYDDIHNRIAHGFTREAHIFNTIENSRGVVHSMQLRPEYIQTAPNGSTVMTASANDDMFAIREQRDLEALSIIESRGLGWQNGEYYDVKMDGSVSVGDAWQHLDNAKDVRLSRSDERKLFDIRYEMYETDPSAFSKLKDNESIPAGLTKREIKKKYYDQFVYGPKLGTQFTDSNERLLTINKETEDNLTTIDALNVELASILDDAGLIGIYKNNGNGGGYVTKKDYTSVEGSSIPQSTIDLSNQVADKVDPLIKEIDDLKFKHTNLLTEKTQVYNSVESLNRLNRVQNNYQDKFTKNFVHYQNETELLVNNVTNKYNKQLYSFYQPMDVVIPNTAQTNTYNLNWDQASNTWSDATVHSYGDLHGSVGPHGIINYRGPSAETENALRNYYGLVKDISVNPMSPKSYRKEDIQMLTDVQNYAKEFKAIFGKDLEIIPVTGPNGWTYYQFKIPESVLNGQFVLSPNKKYGGQIYQDGGESYIKGSSEDPNIYPDQEYNWYNPLDWYRSYTSIDPEEVLANARNEGYEAWYSVLPKHLQNTNYYDLEGAYEAGLDPVWSEDHNEYHLGSRDPRTGKLFKYEDHPTFNKLIQGETDEGNIIWYDDSGDMYSGKEVPEGMYEFEEYSDQYLNEYLQFVENSLKTGFEPVTGLWKPYKGVDSDGNKEKFYTLGYGHKLSKQEYKLYKKGVSQEKVNEFLEKDIAEAQRKLDVRYGDHQWYRDLHPREKAILLDIEYNVKGGMNAFPKLLDAIKTGNKTLLLTEFWRDLPEGKENRRNQEFKRKFVIPVSNMYKYNKRQTGGEIKQIQEERPVWDKRRSRLKQQLKVYQQGGEISPFAEEELVNLGLIDNLSMPVDNTAVVTNEINFSLLDPEMHLTPKSDDEEGFGEMDFAGSARSNQNDDDEEEDIENEEEEDDDDAGDEEEEDNNEEDDDKDSEDDEKEDDDKEDDEEDDDEEDDEHFTPEPIEVDSYASGRGSNYERMKSSDDTWTGSPNRVSQPMQIPPTRVKPGQIREYQAPIPRDFTSQMLAAEFARSNYGEQEKPLTFDYLQRTYGDYNPGRQQMQQAQDGTELPNVIINENSPQLYDQTDNTIYVHPEDVDGTEIPFIGEHEPDHVLRHELEHYYQNKDIVETTPMAPTALDFDIMSNTASYPGMKSDDPMSNRLIEDRELVMRDMYLQVLDPDGTNFWLQNMDIEDLMDEMALDNEAVYQLERQVMNQPIHVRDYMLARIRGERANLLYNQAIDDVYYDPRTLEGQARMIEDVGRQDAHVVETLKQTAIKNREEGISDHPYIKSEMKTLQKDK